VKSQIPVTVLTGFLGSGKTTLLNRILSENHGKRIAVIENEYGEIGVDNDLVIGAEEEIFEMNNGCICCTVRGDLIRILSNLMKRRDRFDYIMIETTGMADPGPVAQTFFMDDEIKNTFCLDSIVTLVDAKHVVEHFDDSDEVKEQIAFADVVLLNKIDLVSSSELNALETRIHSMNAVAKIYRTKNANIAMNYILDLGGFALERALEVDPQFLEPEYPFEWSGCYHLEAGTYELMLNSGPDPAMSIWLSALPDTSAESIKAAIESAALAFSNDALIVQSGNTLYPDKKLYQLRLDAPLLQFPIEIKQSDVYVFFTEHHPDEFSLYLKGIDDKRLHPATSREYKPDHEHDEKITSVGITTPGELDLDRFQSWLRDLLGTKGPDIFRMKGVLNFREMPERYIFQGVHMLFEGRPDRPWGTEPRKNALIFIGRNLDRDELNAGFAACLD